MTIATRPGTSDSMMVDSIIGQDEYRLRNRRFSGWAIDVGAHIGVAAHMLLAANPDLSVVAVEPVPANADLCRANLARFGDRAHVEEAAAGEGERRTVWHDYTAVEGMAADYVLTNRYIGALYREDHGGGIGTEVPVITLSGLIEKYGMVDVAVIKTDCEGAEYAFLSDPAANAKVQLIVGEYHDDATAGQRIVDTLMFTHDVRVFQRGVTGLFEAVRL